MSTKIIIHPDYHYLADFITHLPGNFDSDGEMLYDHRNIIKRFKVGQSVVVAKRYRRPRLIQKIAYSFFRKSKAERAYLNGIELCRRGFITPHSIAYIEEKSNMLLEDSYYLCENDDTPPIADFIEGKPLDSLLIEDYGIFLGQLHQHGILHHDLNNTNVLCRKTDAGTHTFSLIDNNRMDFYPEGAIPPLEACMENLTRFTGDMNLFRHVAEAYCNARKLPKDTVEKMIAVKKRHDEQYDRKKRILARLKGKR